MPLKYIVLVQSWKQNGTQKRSFTKWKNYLMYVMPISHALSFYSSFYSPQKTTYKREDTVNVFT